MHSARRRPKVTQREYRSLLRQDFVSFAHRSFLELNPQNAYLHNWHIDVIAAVLERCRAAKLKRLIINVPPRSLKSHLASIAFPAYLLGHNPATRIVCASYAQDLADNLAGACRSLMSSKFYQDLFPATRLASTRQSIHDFKTTAHGCRLSTSVGGGLTGRGGDFIVIDDPLKPDEALSETQRKSVNDWYNHTLVSRLDNKATGCIVLIMQRLHEDDLVGHLSSQPGWEILAFPAIAEQDEFHTIMTPYGRASFIRRMGEALHPKREPLEILAEIRRVQGEYTFAGQYQQRPAPLGGGLVKLDWFKTYMLTDCPQAFEMVFQSWDTANKTGERNDYSVCTTWGVSQKRLYLLDLLRLRLDYPALRRLVKSHAESFGVTNILIEDKASGTQLIQDLQADGVYSTTRYESPLDKVSRMSTASSMIENGFVHLPERADWLEAYRHEISVFPNGQYDDQVDSTSQALDWAKRGMLGFWFLEQMREEFHKLNGSIPTIDWGGEARKSSAETKKNNSASACPECGNRNLSRWLVEGITGDKQESCACGWSQVIARPCNSPSESPLPTAAKPSFATSSLNGAGLFPF